MNKERPFEGLKVVDLTTYIAAPTAARFLADWGADVIKVETPSGDPWRAFGPNVKCPTADEENPCYDLYNANKRGITLNMRKPEGMAIMHKLLAGADIFVTNTREGALEKMGLSYDQIKDKYPKLIFATVTGYGETGPDRDLPGYDTVAHWTRSGFLADFAEPSGYPVEPPAGWGDASTGTALFGAICAALYARERTGAGDKVSVSLYGAGIWFGSLQVLSNQDRYGDTYPKPRKVMNPLINYYKCSDGEWVMMSLLDYDKHFAACCEALEAPEIATDPRFNTNQGCLENRADLIPLLETAFGKLPSDLVVARLTKLDMVQARMRHFREIHGDPHAQANDFVRKFQFKNGAEVYMPMSPIKSRNVAYPLSGGPLPGQDRDAILKELGYTDEEIQSFAEKLTFS